MKMKLRLLMLNLNKNILLYFILFVNIILPTESLAIVTKSLGNIEYTKFDASKLIKELDLGSELFNDDYIKTKSNGFIKFSYLDDGTTIKMHKNSELFVRGNIDEYLIQKRINISSGVYNFDISKQKDKAFTIITPTSVASVKGTKFLLMSDSEGTDSFYGFDGIVEVLNKESNTTLRLSRNVKITSFSTGEINSEIMTQTDYNITNEFNNFEQEIDSEEIIPEENEFENVPDQDEQESGSMNESSPTEPTTNEIRITIRNLQGEEKELIIRYNE